MRSGVSLRPAAADDYEFLSDLHEASMRPYVEAIWGWNDEFQVTFFREHHRPDRLRIIELHGRPVGVIGFDLDPERLYVGPFDVVPEVQGRGVGTAALAEVLAIGDAAGVPATLQVLQINSNARRLYERLDFEEVGVTEHHVLMRRPVRQ